jgi:hypothetical protein
MKTLVFPIPRTGQPPAYVTMSFLPESSCSVIPNIAQNSPSNNAANRRQTLLVWSKFSAYNSLGIGLSLPSLRTIGMAMNITGRPARLQTRLLQGAFLAALAVIFAAGCGKPTGIVSGKVYYRDKLVKSGTVTFVTLDGKTGGRSDIAEDGSYSIPDLPLGDVRIVVETKSMKPNAMQARARANLPKNAPPEGAEYLGGGSSEDRYVQIPDKYSEVGTSGLMYTVLGGPQVFKIELQ